MCIAPADPDHQKVHTWKGDALKGRWHVTIKIDGVRALWRPPVINKPTGEEFTLGGWFSRAGTILNNVPAPEDRSFQHNCELYLGSLKETNRAWRTIKLKPDTPRIRPEHLYSLDPIDRRLDLGFVQDPTAQQIRDMLANANRQGYEGLVMRREGFHLGTNWGYWLKVKPHDTFDVRVLSVHEGEGKHKGRLGYVKTHLGKVGTGWSDAERALWWANRVRLVGATIEVECMQLTPDGKFRHARFLRERFDKVADQ